jgi:uncharacterized DUF497 family protein
MTIRYEWDPEKRLANLRRHKLDFIDAWQVYEHSHKVTVADEYKGEDRFRELAEVRSRVHLLVYTLRGDVVRCISHRPATRGETRFYYEEIANR